MIISNIVLFNTTNPSNHNGIQLTITCFDNAIYSQSVRLQSDRKPKTARHKETYANYKVYKFNLDQQLIAIEQNVDLYYCSNCNCKCIDHRIAIDHLCNSLIECCLRRVLLAYLRLRLVSPRRFQDGMILLSKNVNNLFSGTGECGKPYNGDIYNIIKKTRHIYEIYEITFC